MNAPTNNFQTIMDGDRPAFAVIPYDEFVRMRNKDQGLIPNRVVNDAIDHDWTILKAWRKHLKLSQVDIAGRVGITQAAYSQIESSKHESRRDTLLKIANAMDLTIEQLLD